MRKDMNILTVKLSMTTILDYSSVNMYEVGLLVYSSIQDLQHNTRNATQKDDGYDGDILRILY